METSTVTEKRFRTNYGFEPRSKKSIFDEIRWKAVFPTRKTIFNLFPILGWLPKYDIRAWLLADVITGLTVGIMQIPQGMAYSLLAGQHPVYGLYSGFFPVLIYTLFGTSRHISMGSYALTSLMIGAAMETMVPGPVQSSVHETTNVTSQWDAVYAERILYANAITFLVGILLLSFSVFHLGFITRLFARPVQSGFICGVAFLTVVSQLKSLFGVKTGSYSGPMAAAWVIRDIIISLTSLDDEGRWHTTASSLTSLICVTFLVIAKVINTKYKKKLPLNIPLPGEMIVVVCGTVISWAADLENRYHVLTVGPIPGGIPTPKVPLMSLLGSVLAEAIPVAIVGYSVAVSLAQTFAERAGYKIRPNQELVAIGSSNLFASFFSCIPSFTAMSRSCVQFESGGKTQLVGWISSILMLFVLLFIGPVFQYIPKACLGSIVVVAVSGLFLNVYDAKRYWTNHKLDSVTWVVTCLATVFLDVTLGLVFGICFLLLCVVVKTSYVTMRQLHRIDVTQVYREQGMYEKGRHVDDHVIVVRFHGPLNFLNSATLRSSLIRESGIDPVFEKRKAENNRKISETCDATEPDDTSVKHQDIELTRLNNDATMTSQSIKAIVLECSGISSVDSVGVIAITKAILDYKEIGIDLLLATCSENVLDCFQTMDDCDVTDIAYVTTHDAVEYALKSIKETL